MKNTMIKNILVFIISILVLASVIVAGLIHSKDITYSDAKDSGLVCMRDTTNKAKESFLEEYFLSDIIICYE
ncbi:MAG: hypothetical protein BWX72_00638 [Firmicutes bacterium ADurb.Bin080]|jgi:hypothetical protein|nr:hypothetical protein [Clostridiales bacterium]OQC16503.1 MAG: hypothetical protein BWX72_00638 [Firmicutes bacterium ADurb.Bin080]